MASITSDARPTAQPQNGNTQPTEAHQTQRPPNRPSQRLPVPSPAISAAAQPSLRDIEIPARFQPILQKITVTEPALLQHRYAEFVAAEEKRDANIKPTETGEVKL